MVPDCEEHNEEHDDDCPVQANSEVHKTFASGSQAVDQLVDLDQAPLHFRFSSHGIDGTTLDLTSTLAARHVEQLFLRHCALLI